MILYRYILKNHAGPFIFSILTLTFIFLFNFLTKAADRLVGKGLGFWVITKLIVFNLAWMVVLIVPMSVLVATLMAYGNMSHNNEVSIMKASGISVYKMILPAFILSIIIGFLLIQFNNNVYPDANHEARLLFQDITNKKPTLSLVPGQFSQEVPNYSILVRKIDENSNVLEGVTIYDYSDPSKLNVVTAKKGKLYFSNDQKKLIMDLSQGEIHETDPTSRALYRKLLFNNHRIAMNAEQFSFQQSAPGGPRGDRELSAPDMLVIVDSLQKISSNYKDRLSEHVGNYFTGIRQFSFGSYSGNNDAMWISIQDRINAAKNVILSDASALQYNNEQISSYMVEVHKKYSIPAACIVFVLIGAPLGIMTRKGGIGVAAGISILFFLVYWAFLIGGEKLADRGLLSPFWGMWSANFVLGILGILLTVRSAKGQVSIDLSFFSRLIPQRFKNSAGTDDDENN